jgi:hypothetical protein
MPDAELEAHPAPVAVPAPLVVAMPALMPAAAQACD